MGYARGLLKEITKLESKSAKYYKGDRVFGNAQNTDVATGHHETSIKILTDVSKTEDSQNIIYRDLGLKKALGDKVELTTNIRPDITIIKPDGTIKIIEVVSESQNKKGLKDKCRKAITDIEVALKKADMKDRKIEFKVYTPEQVFEKYPELAKKHIKK